MQEAQSAAARLERLTAAHPGRLQHTLTIPRRPARHAPWPDWVAPAVRNAYAARGVEALYAHQAAAMEAARSGRDVVIATGTASGKSIAYLAPALSAIDEGRAAPNGRGATALYLAPTKALAHDQRRAIDALGIDGLRVAAYDGDTDADERRWARSHADYVLTNPDMLHHGILPGHEQWSPFLRRLRYVVIDECHMYRGVFGAHVAAIVRRLQRICAHHGSNPVFILASATIGDPGDLARRLLGRDAVVVDDDASPRGETLLALWEPQTTGELGIRRSASAEAADLLGDLVIDEVRTLAFVKSRKLTEAIAQNVRERLHGTHPELQGRVAAYRAGFLPEERRALESRLRDGDLTAVATTNALELGVDLRGLDAVILTGWPGTRAAMWQQIGRAGRDQQGALALLIAQDDPLDTYVMAHPEVITGQAPEAVVCDPTNPYVLAPHLMAAAAELPLRDATDIARFGPTAQGLVDDLTRSQWLRKRPTGWYWTRNDRASDYADIRGSGGAPVRVVEDGTGRLLGTVDQGAADRTVHAGAIYLHQGESYLVRDFDVTDGVAFVNGIDVDYYTQARSVDDLSIVSVSEQQAWGPITVANGMVDVTGQVVSFARRRLVSGESLGEEPLDLPVRTLRTRAVWWTLPAPLLDNEHFRSFDLGGAAHAAEHAAIGLLPLIIECDRWDIGGLSTVMHADTGQLTVFVHDGQSGGGGFADKAYIELERWLTATLELLRSCECTAGCPGCVQSPKCGNGNEPLDKAGAIALLELVLSHR